MPADSPTQPERKGVSGPEPCVRTFGEATTGDAKRGQPDDLTHYMQRCGELSRELASEREKRERIADLAELATIACGDLLPLEGSRGAYRVSGVIDSKMVALPEEWAEAAQTIADLDAALASLDAGESGGDPTGVGDRSEPSNPGTEKLDRQGDDDQGGVRESRIRWRELAHRLGSERDEARAEVEKLRRFRSSFRAAMDTQTEINRAIAGFPGDTTVEAVQGLVAEVKRVRQERDAALADRLHLTGEVERLRGREAHFARVLQVADGGEYRNDWDARIEELVAERDRLRASRPLPAEPSGGDPRPCMVCDGTGHVGDDVAVQPGACPACGGSGVERPPAPSTGDGEPERRIKLSWNGRGYQVDKPGDMEGEYVDAASYDRLRASRDAGLLSLLEDHRLGKAMLEAGRRAYDEDGADVVATMLDAARGWLREHSPDGASAPSWRMLGEVADEIGQAAHDLDGHPFSEGSVRQLREWEARLREIDEPASSPTGQEADRDGD